MFAVSGCALFTLGWHKNVLHPNVKADFPCFEIFITEAGGRANHPYVKLECSILMLDPMHIYVLGRAPHWADASIQPMHRITYTRAIKR